MRRAFDAWNRGDLEALVALCHPGVRFRSLIAAAEGDKAHRGHAGVRDWWRQVEEVFTNRRMEVSEIRSRGQWTIVTGVGHGQGRASGADVRWPYVSVVRAVDGLLSDWRFFTDPEEAEGFVGDGRR